MSDFEKELLDRVYEEAAEISRQDRVAAVYRLPKGKYIASSASRHMIPGTLIASFIDGKETTI